MTRKPTILTLDFESILGPEAWIEIAEHTGINELKLTTRDITDYDELMKKRLKILSENNISLKDIQDIATKMKPLEGAVEFLSWLRKNYQVIILSDTYYEFIEPLLKKFDYPTIFCLFLVVDDKGYIIDYYRREKGDKKDTVQALKNLGFNIIAVGDSYNDIDMLREADIGMLFNCSENIAQEFPEFPRFQNYEGLKAFIETNSK